MPGLDPRQVISDYLGVPSVVISDTPTPRGVGGAANSGVAAWERTWQRCGSSRSAASRNARRMP